MKKNFKKEAKNILKKAGKNPCIKVTASAATGAFIGTGAAFIAEKAVGKVICKIREKKTEKKA